MKTITRMVGPRGIAKHGFFRQTLRAGELTMDVYLSIVAPKVKIAKDIIKEVVSPD